MLYNEIMENEGRNNTDELPENISTQNAIDSLVPEKKNVPIPLIPIVIITVIIFAVFFVISNRETNTDIPTEERQTNSFIEEKDGRIFDRQNHFSMEIAPGWKVINENSISWPFDVSNVSFILGKENTHCVFAAVEPSNEHLFQEELEEVSYAERTYFRDMMLISGSWYVLLEDVPELFYFSTDKRQKLEREIRINNLSYLYFYDSMTKRNAMEAILFDSIGQVVDDGCDKDVTLMLPSITIEYEYTDIYPESNGILYFRPSEEEKNPDEYIMFIEDGGVYSKIADTLNIDYLPIPKVYKNKLYFTNNGKKIIEYDFTRKHQSKEIYISEKYFKDGSVINDFLPFKDKIYLLLGPDCNDYKASCSLDLYEYQADTHIMNLLASNLGFRNILGLDELENILYLSYSDGDVGALWGRTGVFDFNTYKLIDFGYYSYMYEDYEYLSEKDLETRDRINAFDYHFKDKNVYTEYLHIENGQIKLPQDEIYSNSKNRKILFLGSDNLSMSDEVFTGTTYSRDRKNDPGKFLNLSGNVYFNPDYFVGLSLDWNSVPGAVKYEVTHWRLDANGWASPKTITTGLSSSSGRHQNAGAPNECYYRIGVVVAIDKDENIIDRGHVFSCEIGYKEGPTQLQ